MKNMLPNKLEAVFLDFDGVVLESADIKTQAFYELYLPWGEEKAEYAKKYHLQNQGVSRYKKFEVLHEALFDKICSLEKQQKLSKNFTEIVFEKVLRCPFVEGALDFLSEMKKQNIPVFLISATPHDELLSICANRDITHYFYQIYGSPYEKSDVIKELIANSNFQIKNTIFVGDSTNDFKAAKLANVPFLGRILTTEANPFESYVPVISNFKSLLYA